MKTTLLLSTLALALVGATPSFAQSAPGGSSYSPAFGFPSYAEPGPRAPYADAPQSLGTYEYGYARDGRTVRLRDRQ